MQIHIRIIGRVQGVGYRAWTVRQAQELNLFGFVRNRRDKSVEIWAQGSGDQVNELLIRCQKGPIFARVDEIKPISFPDAPLPDIEKNVFKSYATV